MSDKRKRITRRQLVSQIRGTMPDNLTELEKAAFIEMKVAERISFDEQYLWGNCREQIYKLAKREVQKPKQEIKPKLICVTMAELYAYAARELGLNVQYQRYSAYENEIGSDDVLEKLNSKTQEHLCPILYLSDGRKIKVDIQQDLENLQTRCRPVGFGGRDLEAKLDCISPRELHTIFRKVYGLDEGQSFTDDYIQELISKQENATALQKIRYVLQDSRIQEEMQKTGCAETRKFCKKILRPILGYQAAGRYSSNKTEAFLSICALSNQAGDKRYSLCLRVNDASNNENLMYILSTRNRKMVEITPENLQQMVDQSMLTLNIREMPGKHLIEFAPNSNTTSPENTKLNQFSETFFGDYEEEK